jgi:hypothetical protein
MKHKRIIKTKATDKVEIVIECEGREPIQVFVTPTDSGNRFVTVKASDGGCGTIADSDKLFPRAKQ